MKSEDVRVFSYLPSPCPGYRALRRVKKKVEVRKFLGLHFFVSSPCFSQGGGVPPWETTLTCYRREPMFRNGADHGGSPLYIDFGRPPWARLWLWQAITRLLLERFSSGLKLSLSWGVLCKRPGPVSHHFFIVSSHIKHFCRWQGHRSLRR